MHLFKQAINKSRTKTLDIVIANAGISGRDDIFHDDVDDNGEPVEPDLRILETNLKGVILSAKLAMHYLPRQTQRPDSDRCLIMTASLAAYLDLPQKPQYGSSKWGVRGLMRSLRRTAPHVGVRVNTIAPW